MGNDNNQDHWYASWFDTPYYHILYKDRGHEEAAQFMRNLTDSLNLNKNAHILDLACGRGRHSMFLNQLGYRVTGVDLSENSIAYAKASLTGRQAQLQNSESFNRLIDQVDASRINFEVHDMTKPMIQNFDAVFNLFTSFGYFEDEKDNLRTIQAIKENLKTGACAVIDFLNVPYVLKNLVVKDQKTEQGITFHQQRQYIDGYIVKKINFSDQSKDFHFTERVKALMVSDFQSYFDTAGLELIDLYGNYALESYDQFKSDRLIMVIKNK